MPDWSFPSESGRRRLKGAARAGRFAPPGPCDSQPKMQAALRNLHAAWDSLNGALPDKGGHRAAAMDLIKTTIGEVQAGCIAGGG